MCLILHKPAGRTVPGSIMAEAYANNGDGLGWMAGAEVERIPRVRRKHVKHLTHRLNTALRDVEVAVHFRWRTHGKIDFDNTHPYPLHDGGYLMHNGVLAGGNFYDPDRSDTWHYIAFDLYGRETHADSAVWDSVERDIGPGNKFLIMDSAHAMRVVNRSAGRTYQGLWLSNTYSTPNHFRSARSAVYTSKGDSAPLGGYSTEYIKWRNARDEVSATYRWDPTPPRNPPPVTLGAMQRKALEALHRRQYGVSGLVTAESVEDRYPNLARIARDADGDNLATRLEAAERAYPLK